MTWDAGVFPETPGMPLKSYKACADTSLLDWMPMSGGSASAQGGNRPKSLIRGMSMDLIVKMTFGAHLYGTATVASDLDYKGIFLPSREEILLGRIPKCRSFATGSDLFKNLPGDIDEDVYSLNYFIKLACEGQTVAMDMLHAPEALLSVNTPIWQAIVAQRHRFYTKRLSAFITYARRQASKYGIKGSRLNAAAQVLKVLKAENPDHKLRRIWDLLPHIEHCFFLGSDPSGMRQYQVCGKTFQESTAIGHVIPILNKFLDDYGHRAKLAAENKNIDWKAVSHALRAALQTREILLHQTIRFPLEEAHFLKDVKQGRLDYTNVVAPSLEELMDQVEQLLNSSNLPEQADTAYWDRFICDTLEKYRFRRA